MRRPAALALLALAACAHRAPAAPAPTARYRALDKVHARLDADWRAGLAPRTELVLIVEIADAAAADPARLRAVGAHQAYPVRITARTPHGWRAEAGRGAYLVHAPVEALPFLAALPWVRTIAGAIAWPGGAPLPDPVRRRLAPELRDALDTHGATRPIAVGGAGEAAGCLDPARRDALAAMGVVLGAVIEAPACDHTIFTFEVPTDVLVELASLPWITVLEGARPMAPD